MIHRVGRQRHDRSDAGRADGLASASPSKTVEFGRHGRADRDPVRDRMLTRSIVPITWWALTAAGADEGLVVPRSQSNLRLQPAG
jgi:hypothetical protein